MLGSVGFIFCEGDVRMIEDLSAFWDQDWTVACHAVTRGRLGHTGLAFAARLFSCFREDLHLMTD